MSDADFRKTQLPKFIAAQGKKERAEEKLLERGKIRM
jgi:hypothetical protein